jgi:hypothetical protein
MRTGPYFAAACFAIFFSVFLPGHVLLAQDQDKPAVAPPPRTINLTEEQRHIIKENVKDMAVPKAHANAPETIGDVVPIDIKYPNCHPWPGEKWRRPGPICFL